MTNTKHKDYILWLIDKLKFKDKPNIELFEKLFNYPFAVIVKGDEIRVNDAIRLQDEYGELDRDPSVLEVLVALCIRIDNGWIDKGPSVLFTELLNNIGLDVNSDIENKDFQIIMRKLVYRLYDQNGKGGLFPLRKPSSNQRQESLYQQCMAYIQENEERLIN